MLGFPALRFPKNPMCTRLASGVWFRFSAMLFLSAKVSQLALLPQGKVEAAARAKNMLAKMDELGFGACTNTGACAAECPKNISLTNIARLNREFICAKLKD